jgi:hypothetical protein
MSNTRLWEQHIFDNIERERKEKEIEYQRKNVPEIIEKGLNNAYFDLQTKIDRAIANIDSTVEGMFLEDEKEEALAQYKRQIAHEYRTDKSIYTRALELHNDEKAVLGMDNAIEFFIEHVESISSIDTRIKFLNEFEERFEKTIINICLFQRFKEDDQLNSIVENEPLPDTFPNFVKEPFSKYLEKIRMSYLGSRPKEKVMMLFAMQREFDMLKHDFVLHNQTELHNMLVVFFGKESEVGVRTGFWATIDSLKNRKDDKFLSGMEYHINKISEIVSS